MIYAIDTAPGMDLICKIQNSGSSSDFEQFFWIRTKWCGGYPLVHDRLCTYGAFDDLIDTMDSEQRYKLIPFTARFTATVPDQYFHAALFLLESLIPDDRIGGRPDDFSDILLRIRLRVEKLSFLPNLCCAWDTLALKQRYLKSEEDFLRKYSQRHLKVDGSRWRAYFQFPLPNNTKNIFRDCRVDMGWLRTKIQKMSCPPGARQLILATRFSPQGIGYGDCPDVSGLLTLTVLPICGRLMMARLIWVIGIYISNLARGIR